MSLLKEIIVDVGMTPDQRRLVFTAIKTTWENGKTDVNLNEFCHLFKDIDSVYRSVLPRRRSKMIVNIFITVISSIV